MGVDARVYVRTKKKFTDEEILHLAYEIGLAFGADRFFRFEADTFGPGHHNISRVAPGEEPDLKPALAKGETLLEVHVWTRYYGPGYERGDLPFLIAVGEWLERKIPSGLVLYGGDSGDGVDPFDTAARAKLLDHFAGEDGRAYFTAGNPYMGKTKKPTCALCRVPMAQYGWGGGRGNLAGAFNCGGCGAQMSTKDGVTFTPIKKGEAWHG